MEKENYKSGFVAIIGRTNVGKSSFVNKVVGKKVSIMSNKPQTTRNRLLGIMTTDSYQICFTDTPGVHKPKLLLDTRMVSASYDSLRDTDAIIFMTTPLLEVLKGDEIIIRELKKQKAPVFLVINKIDVLKHQSDIDKSIVLYKDLMDFKGIYPISVNENINIDTLINDILKEIPVGPQMYPTDMISDHSNRFLISEIIREKVLEFTNEEVPHSVACIVDSLKDCPDNANYKDIYATIYVERDSQKKIIIGSNGNMIKSIKEKAMMDIKHLLNSKIHLELWVKVKKDWRSRPDDLKKLGYSEDDF